MRTEEREIPWQPRYAITPAIAQSLMRIEAARTVVARTPLPLPAEEELRRRARIRSTHYSTRIEGNRLTLEETEQVVIGGKTKFAGRERDVREVQNYWNAFQRMEEWVARRRPFTESLIRRLHALVEHGARAKPTPYRDGQNVIRDATTGSIVYLPPMTQDIPSLMASLVRWCEQAERDNLPFPLIAGLVHYQFVTIHPYYDGNGRTARLLATFLLHRGGYGLNGFFSLEEYHARDLDTYYESLAVHPHHNYYEGRATADLTSWLTYFTGTLARVFALAEEEALRASQEGFPAEPSALRQLDTRTRRVVGLFVRGETITAAEAARLFGISDRAARSLLQELTAKGVLHIRNSSNRARSYELSEVYRKFIGSLSEAE